MNDTIIIDIEACHNCFKHNWLTHHTEQKYDHYYNLSTTFIIELSQTNSNLTLVKNRLLQDYPDIMINKNRIPLGYIKLRFVKHYGEDIYYNQNTNHIMTLPRIGAFEIKIDGMLIYSKLKSKSWPSIPNIILMIKKIIKEKRKGIDIRIYDISNFLTTNYLKHDYAKEYKPKLELKHVNNSYRNLNTSNSSSSKRNSTTITQSNNPAHYSQINSKPIDISYRLANHCLDSMNKGCSNLLVDNQKSSMTLNNYLRYRSDIKDRSESPIPCNNKGELSPLKFKLNYHINPKATKKKSVKKIQSLRYDNVHSASSKIHNNTLFDKITHLYADSHEESLICSPRSLIIDLDEKISFREDPIAAAPVYRETFNKNAHKFISLANESIDLSHSIKEKTADEEVTEVLKTAEFPSDTCDYDNANGIQDNNLNPTSNTKLTGKISQRYSNDIKLRLDVNDIPICGKKAKMADSLSTISISKHEKTQFRHKSKLHLDDLPENPFEYLLDPDVTKNPNYGPKQNSSKVLKTKQIYQRFKKMLIDNKDNIENKQQIDQKNFIMPYMLKPKSIQNI